MAAAGEVFHLYCFRNICKRIFVGQVLWIQILRMFNWQLVSVAAIEDRATFAAVFAPDGEIQ